MRLGHFQILERLGHGGMGMVYSAYDLHLDRKVAIKVLQGSHAGDFLLKQQLVREAQVMAKLSHPNVVSVYEVGIADETVFIAMEYIAGGDLAHWLDEHDERWGPIVDKFVEAARGLAAAHIAGVIHRDFKSTNVLVDRHGHVRVTDFGIALVSGPAEWDDADAAPSGGSPVLGDHGARFGTSAYMSPEQHRGDVVDARSDQFSFCVALYEALFRKHPFAGRGSELADAIAAGRIEVPDPDSDVPSRVTAAVMRGMSADPAKRFASMTELIDVLARDPSRRRRRIVIGAIGVTALAATAGLLGWGLRPAHADPCEHAAAPLAGIWDDARRVAVERSLLATASPFAAASARRVASAFDAYRTSWIAMRSDACRATRIRGEQSEHVLDLRNRCLDRRLAELDALASALASTLDTRAVEHAVTAASSLTPLAACADTAALLLAPETDGARGERSALQARLDPLIAQRRLGADKALIVPARALVVDARRHGDAGLTGAALDLEGELEIEVGELGRAEATLGDALGRARDARDADLFAAVAIDLVAALANDGTAKTREAAGVLRIAKAIQDDTHDPAIPVELLVEEAQIMLAQARPDPALSLLDDAAARARRELGDDDPRAMHVQAVLAAALGASQRHAKAIAAYDVLIASATRALGGLHPTTIVGQLERCRVLVASGKLAGASACFTPVLVDAERVIAAGDPRVLAARVAFGRALIDGGELERARDVLAIAVEHVAADAWHDRWPPGVDAARLLGTVDVELGSYQEGLAHCRQAEAATDTAHAKLAPETCVGEALLGLGQATQALAVLDAVKAATDGADPAQVGAWRFAYARAVWAASHDAARARSLAIQARGELAARRRPGLDAWLAKLPS